MLNSKKEIRMFFLICTYLEFHLARYKCAGVTIGD